MGRGDDALRKHRPDSGKFSESVIDAVLMSSLLALVLDASLRCRSRTRRLKRFRRCLVRCLPLQNTSNNMNRDKNYLTDIVKNRWNRIDSGIAHNQEICYGMKFPGRCASAVT